MKHKIPPEATWECVCKRNGRIGRIWYEGKSEYNFHIWRWGVWCSSGREYICGDWTKTYSQAKTEIPVSGRFKRIKDK